MVHSAFRKRMVLLRNLAVLQTAPSFAVFLLFSLGTDESLIKVVGDSALSQT